MNEPIVLDWGVGLGGWSAPFREHGCARVIGLDIDPKVHPDVIADIQHSPINGPVTGILGSMPCQKFSTAAGRHRNPEEGMVLVRAFMEEVERLDPEWWFMENVRGARKPISAEFGPPMMMHRSWIVWGRGPGFLLPHQLPFKGPKLPSAQPVWMRAENRIFWRNRSDGWGSRESGKVAMIPSELAGAVHEAVCPKGATQENPSP